MRWLPALAVLAACGPPTVRVAGVVVELYTPADVDPMEGADAMVVRVLDADGTEVATGTGSPGGTIPIPPITTFGQVEIEVTARDGGQVLSAARSGLVNIRTSGEQTLRLLFLPVNEAVPLSWTPNANRVGHSAVPLPDGNVLLIGGRAPSSSIARTDSELWSPATGFAGEGPVLSEGIAHARQARLPDGTVIIAGGDTEGGASDVVLSVSADGSAIDALPSLSGPATAPCVASHPTLGAIIAGPTSLDLYTSLGRVGTTPFDGAGIEACAGTGGFVVTAGASDRWGVMDLREAEWPFDLPTQVTWLPGQPQLDAPHVVALPQDRVWIGGGYGFDATISTRIVEPARLEITEARDLQDGRTGAQAAPWRDGRVVLAGGWSDDVKSAPVRSVSIHDPATGPVLTLPLPVRDPTLTVLHGGTLLITGGLDEAGEAAGASAIVPWTDDG